MTTTVLKKGYKMTEIGVIPEDWEVNLIEQFGSVIDGDRGHNYPSSDDFRPDGYCLFLSAANVTKTGFKFDECQFISKEKEESLSKGKLKRGDVVLTTRGTVGNIAYYKDSIPYSHMRINSGMVLLRVENKSRITQDFLYELCKSNILVNQIDRLSFGSAQPQLTVKGISSFQFPLPPTLSEQQAISKVLSDIDELISSLDELTAKKRRIKEGAMQELLTGKKRLAGFSGKWVVKQLIEIANFYDNLRVPIAESKREDGITPYFGANGIQGYIKGHTHNGEFVLIAEDGANDLNNYPVLYVNGKVWVNNHAHVIQGKKECVNTKYLSYALKTVNFVHILVGGTRAKLNGSVAKSIKIIIPNDIAEQTAIAKILSDMDAEITALEQKREKYKLVKQGMMQVFLTGKIRLI